jgi:hypothetical protein
MQAVISLVPAIFFIRHGLIKSPLSVDRTKAGLGGESTSERQVLLCRHYLEQAGTVRFCSVLPARR